MLGESFTRGNAISEMQYCIRCESNRARPVTQTILDITKGRQSNYDYENCFSYHLF